MQEQNRMYIPPQNSIFAMVGNWIDLLFDGKTEKRHICINFVKLPPTLQLIQIKMSHSKTCLSHHTLV